MTKRLLKKYLAAFGLTLKHSEVCGKQIRRFGLQSYLLPAHPLACRRRERGARERARVLPALLKSKIDAAAKRQCDARVYNYEPMDVPAWSEQGSKPRRRLYSQARFFIDIPDYAGDLTAHRAEVNRRFSALFRERPQIIGKRIQSGNRLCR